MNNNDNQKQNTIKLVPDFNVNTLPHDDEAEEEGDEPKVPVEKLIDWNCFCAGLFRQAIDGIKHKELEQWG